MKKICLVVAILSFNLIGIGGYNPLLNNQVLASELKETIIVEGSSYYDGNTDFSERKAISEALKKAVSKVLALWIQNGAFESLSEDKKDDILEKYEEYIKSYKLLSKKIKGDFYTVNLEVTVKIEEIKSAFKKKVKSISSKMSRPSIAFVLTTWKKVGETSSKIQEDTNEMSLENKASDSVKKVYSYDTPDSSYLDAIADNPNLSIDHKATFKKKNTTGKIDETLWEKYPDSSIIDSFKEEFLERNFIIKAADKAEHIALSGSMAETSVNPFDRESVKIFAQKEGVNFITRGEISILGKIFNESTASTEINGKITVEMIDVDSGQLIANYSSTATASGDDEEKIKFQLIKKLANLASKKLSKKTLSIWEDFIQNGRRFIVEVQNITSNRNQKEPFLDVLKDLNAEVNSTTSDNPKNALIEVTCKTKKELLGSNILKKLQNKKGFSEKEFDGPYYNDGKIIFKFISLDLKKAKK